MAKTRTKKPCPEPQWRLLKYRRKWTMTRIPVVKAGSVVHQALRDAKKLKTFLKKDDESTFGTFEAHFPKWDEDAGCWKTVVKHEDSDSANFVLRVWPDGRAALKLLTFDGETVFDETGQGDVKHQEQVVTDEPYPDKNLFGMYAGFQYFLDHWLPRADEHLFGTIQK